MSKVRLGIVGAGNMGQTAHIQNFARIHDCQLVALAEGRKETAKRVAEKYGIAEVYPDHRAMLASADVDAVVAIMDYRLHPSVVPDLLNAGKHVMTEKPICLRADNAARLVELARANDVIYMVGYMKRSLAATQEAVAQISAWKDSGVAGKMHYLRASMPPGDWTFGIQWGINAGDTLPAYQEVTPEVPPEWMGEEHGAKYNAFVNYYIHQVNLIRYLIGDDYSLEYADKGEAVLVGRSRGGVTLILEMKGYGLHNSWEEYYKVSFENGRIDLSVPAPMAQQNGGDVRIYWGGDSEVLPRWENPIMPPVWSMFSQAQHFIECVRDQSPTRSPASDALKDLEIAESYVKLLGGF